MRDDAAAALLAMPAGYRLDIDFSAVQEPNGVRIDWHSQSPMPSEAEIDAFDMSPAAVSARENAKEPLLADLFAQAAAAIADNNAFLAIPGTPSNAQILAQTKRHAQQNTQLIRGLFRVIQRTWRNGQVLP